MVAWQAYVKSHLNWCDTLQLSKVVMPFAVRPQAGQAEQVVLDAGGSLPAPLPEGSTGLARAWAVAKLNVDRADFRVAAAYTLMAAARGRAEKLAPTASKQSSVLTQRLWHDRQVALVNFFALGALVGEAAQGEILARSKAMFGNRSSIMQLLAVDGVHPSSWFSAEEQLLRDQIAGA
jgi:hypothetical protein